MTYFLKFSVRWLLDNITALLLLGLTAELAFIAYLFPTYTAVLILPLIFLAFVYFFFGSFIFIFFYNLFNFLKFLEEEFLILGLCRFILIVLILSGLSLFVDVVLLFEVMGWFFLKAVFTISLNLVEVELNNLGIRVVSAELDPVISFRKDLFNFFLKTYTFESINAGIIDRFANPKKRADKPIVLPYSIALGFYDLGVKYLTNKNVFETFNKTVWQGYSNYIAFESDYNHLPMNLNKAYDIYFSETYVSKLDGMGWLIKNNKVLSYKSISEIGDANMYKSYVALVEGSAKKKIMRNLVLNLTSPIKHLLNLELKFNPLTDSDFNVLFTKYGVYDLAIKLIKEGKPNHEIVKELMRRSYRILEFNLEASNITQKVVIDFLEKRGVAITDAEILSAYKSNSRLHDTNVSNVLKGIKLNFTSKHQQTLFDGVVRAYEFGHWHKPWGLSQNIFWKCYFNNFSYFRLISDMLQDIRAEHPTLWS